MNITPRPHPSIPSLTRAAAASLAVTIVAALGAVPAAATDEAASCWTETPGVVGTIDHPTDPTAVVLRMFTGGGFVPMEIAFMETPAFTLYGNNVAIYRPADPMTELTAPLTPFFCSRLTPDQVDELLAYALDETGLRTADDRYAHPYIVDTPNTTFTIDADGIRRDIVVEALGFDDLAPDPDARARFQALADQLTAFDAVVESQSLYEVPLYQAMLTAPWAVTDDPVLPWPWDDVPPELFGREGSDIVTLTPEQAAQVTPVPGGGQAFIPVQTPDGTQVSLTIRPLLPDEAAALPTPAQAG